MENNKERIQNINKKYYMSNKEKFRLRNKSYRENNKEKIKITQHNYYLKMQKKLKAYQKEFYSKLENKETRRLSQRKWRKNNKERYLINAKNYRIVRRRVDSSFNLQQRIRYRLWSAFKNYSDRGKKSKSDKYGINYNKIIEHLKPFPKDIEKYHIDHIIPLSKFDFNDPKQIKWAFAPENHQWLTKEENLKKGDRFIFIKEPKD